jgi:hypothetical protein
VHDAHPTYSTESSSQNSKQVQHSYKYCVICNLVKNDTCSLGHETAPVAIGNLDVKTFIDEQKKQRSGQTVGWPCLMCETANTMSRAECAFCGSQRYTIDFDKLVSEAHAFIRVQLVNKPVAAYKRQASSSSNGSFAKRSQASNGSNNSDQDKFFMITELKCLKC